MFCSIGFSKQSERQLIFWEERQPNKPLSEVQIDIASGTLLPFFDVDTNLLFLAGKGDTNIRYFEIDNAEPYQYYVAQFLGKDPQRGVAWVPKRGLDVAGCEIARLMRFTQHCMEPVTFSVPRKGDQFQGDLYPDTFAGKAALKSKEWFDGNNAAPVLMSMNPNDTSVRAVVKEQGQAVNLAGGGGGRGSSAGAGISAPAPAPEAGIDAASKAMLSRLEKKVASLEEENKKLKAEAEESDRLKGLVEELQSKNSRLEAQIAKMG
mmetsp:Transcript_22124/g.34693  ORF Transcript_22124/g.34693 Transcript_22124/m.34693 type:complete len:264 (-) Transcript_22124:316-1107(-)